MREEDFDEFTSDSFKDFDISSISGSEDEAEKEFGPNRDLHRGTTGNSKQHLYIRLNTGEQISFWKSLLINESENISIGNDIAVDNGASAPCLEENDVIERVKSLIREPRDNTRLRIVLLASGGHFAGCVFDGSLVVAHKTFHRLVHLFLSFSPLKVVIIYLCHVKKIFEIRPCMEHVLALHSMGCV